MSLSIRHITRSEARKAVADWHSHHKPHVGDIICLGAFLGGELVAVEVLGRPISPVLDNGQTWEITRQAIGPNAPKFTSSRLHGRATRLALAAGCDLVVTYTRVDEIGSSLLASNFRPVAIVKGREHTTGNRSTRWLPGLYEPSTETIDRVRWEYGPAAHGTACKWSGSRWVSLKEAT